MANDNQIQMEFVIEEKSIKTEFAKIEKQAEKTQPKVQEAFNKKGVVDFAAGVFIAEKALQVFNFAISKVVAVVSRSIDLAVEAEAANIKLAAAFGTLDPVARSTEQRFRDFASALQSKIAVDDDFIKSNAAVLVSLGRLSGEGLERATLAAFDLAKGIDTTAESAFFLLSKAAAGSTEALSKYGIRVDQTLSKSQKFEAILKQIEQRFGGLAQADTKTFGGAVKVLNLAFEDLLQTFGGIITKSPALIAVIKSISDSIVSVTTSLAKAGGGEDIFKPILIGVLNVGLAVNEFLIKPLELGFNLLRTGILTVYTVIQGLIALLAQIPAKVTEFLVAPLTKVFGFVAEKIIGLFDSEAAAKVSNSIIGFGTLLETGARDVADSTSAVFQDSFEALSDSAENNFTSKIGASLENFLTKLKTTAEQAKAVQSDLANNTVVETEKMANAWDKAKEQIDKAIQQGIVQSIGSGLSKIGENLAKGANAFDNFTNVVLSILGDLAIQVGTILIGMGLGIEQLKVALATFDGFSLVAAGAALVVLGGALKGLAGGSGGASPAAAGGAPNFSGGIGATPVQENELQPQRSQVQVNISGDVFDTDETGLRIVDILNKSFDQQGVTVRGMA